MSKYSLSGEIVSVGEVKEFKNDFKVREVVVDVSTNAEYPSPIILKFQKDHVDLPSGVQRGDKVSCDFYLDGRYGKDKWEGKIFNSIRAVSLDVVRDGPKMDDIEKVDPDDNLPLGESPTKKGDLDDIDKPSDPGLPF